MKKCPRCSAELADSAIECIACGLSIGDRTEATAVLPADPQANTPTKLSNPSDRNTTHSTTGGGARFISGTVLAGRYRIVGLIGKGGMGEVYKADDLELDQTVALKFLPEELSKNEELLRRFRGEVRNARKVSHRNVCRVFDIGETEGLYYLTMEHIDGDDLAMLLKRIGRLPSDKAVEISRDICMGLAAIHKAGILHRDLKPANIIVDSNGEARITDFGIAGIEAEVQGNESRVGTPAYMSPEQIDGKEVTQRSDIYSLGLLLYEIFTGKQAFEGDSVQELQVKQATTAPKNPSEIVSGIDPLVENVIKRCLEKDPKKRPETALKVAMSLPGGDPLQIALDAGQTPSPEMVAAAPKVGMLRPPVAFFLVLTVLIAFGLLIGLSTRRTLQHAVPLDRSPDVLRERGRELAEKFGYIPSDSYHRFMVFSGYVDYLKENDQTQDRWKKLESAQPAVLVFLYRSSPEPIVPVAGGEPTYFDPPNNVPGMSKIYINTAGRLIYFEGVPQRAMAPNDPRGEFDWSGLFKEAGLELAAFQPVDPQWTPPHAYDDQRAFSGTYPGAPDVAIRIEAATLRGRLVFFDIIEPWSPLPGQVSGTSGEDPRTIVWIVIPIIMLSGSAWLAVRSVRTGRGDLKNAFRVALLLFGLKMIEWLFSTHHVASVGEYRLLETATAYALTTAVIGGLLYLAFEPYLRKVAPERVIAWNRLLTGGWRDPLVGRDVLIGAAGYSITMIAGLILTYFIPRWLGEPPSIGWDDPAHLGGISIFPGFLAAGSIEALFLSFGVAFFMLFLGLLLRRKWLGAVGVWLLVFIPSLSSPDGSLLETISWIVELSILILIAYRFGVLASISFFLIMALRQIPFAADLTTWYAGNFILVLLVLLALTIYGFFTSIAGQKLWQGKLLGEGD